MVTRTTVIMKENPSGEDGKPAILTQQPPKFIRGEQ
jgi:hypothetical protein